MEKRMERIHALLAAQELLLKARAAGGDYYHLNRVWVAIRGLMEEAREVANA